MTRNLQKKTDNDNLASKVALRLFFLRKYHADGSAKVLDCCQGSGVIWDRIRSMHPIHSYVGVDVKKKKGRLRIESSRLLETRFIQDVIDVDTYGSPWRHWLNLSENLTQPTTVFLTIGRVSYGGSQLSHEELRAVGLHELRTKPPAAFGKAVAELAVSYLLTESCVNAKIIEIVEAPRGKSARYVGVRLEPGKRSGEVGPSPDQTRQSAKGD